MRYLILSDIHGRIEMLERIVSSVSEHSWPLDAILAAGDLTSFGTAEDAREVVDTIRKALPGVPMAAVAGNCDSDGVSAFLEEEGLSVESRVRAIGGILLAGAGGGLYHNGNTLFERKEGDFARAFIKAFRGFSIPGVSGLPFVGMTHTPPYGAEADVRHHRHIGSKDIFEQLSIRNALVWICGHIHEARSISELISTLVINPGPAAEGCHAILDIVKSPAGTWLPKARLLGI